MEQPVGIWVDGKTIYRKVIRSNGNLGDYSETTLIPVYIWASQVDDILPMTCAFLRNKINKDWESVGISSGNSGWMLTFGAGTDGGLYARIKRGNRANWSDREATIVMHYTKTTS